MNKQFNNNLNLLPDFAVSINSLNKVYKSSNGSVEKHALNNVDLKIRRGTFFGLLGPNGAGKSTIINIMAGLVKKTSGTVLIWGLDIDRHERQTRCSIGVVPQELNLDPFFSPRETLEVQAGLYGVPKTERRTDEILNSVGLYDKADVYSRTLSGGMRRRLLIAKAMVHSPPILVLDEPTAGVDVELRETLWNSVREMNLRGTTILLTTHYLEEAEELCDQIAIINDGDVVACDDKDSLLKRIDSKTVVFVFSEPIGVIPYEINFLNPKLRNDNQIEINYRPSLTAIPDILGAVKNSGLNVVDIITEEVELKDIFLQLTS